MYRLVIIGGKHERPWVLAHAITDGENYWHNTLKTSYKITNYLHAIFEYPHNYCGTLEATFLYEDLKSVRLY
jgi:hypothetical protein